MAGIINHFEQYALQGLEKQEKTTGLFRDRIAEIDFDSGFIRFDHDYEFPFQVLGTQSDNTLTFQWAWSEEQDEIPDALMDSARRMRDWARTNNVEELTAPEIDVDKADGRMISLIASEICHAGCYYRETYEGGALFTLLYNVPTGNVPPFTVQSFSRNLFDLISAYTFNHRNAVLAYLDRKKRRYLEEGPTIAWQLDSGEELTLGFDEMGRLVSLNNEPAP